MQGNLYLRVSNYSKHLTGAMSDLYYEITVRKLHIIQKHYHSYQETRCGGMNASWAAIGREPWANEKAEYGRHVWYNRPFE